MWLIVSYCWIVLCFTLPLQNIDFCFHLSQDIHECLCWVSFFWLTFVGLIFKMVFSIQRNKFVGLNLGPQWTWEAETTPGKFILTRGASTSHMGNNSMCEVKYNIGRSHSLHCASGMGAGSLCWIIIPRLRQWKLQRMDKVLNQPRKDRSHVSN